MSSQEFLSEMHRMANMNGVRFRPQKLMSLLRTDIADGATFVNIFAGSDNRESLVMTSQAVWCVRSGALSLRAVWRIEVQDIARTTAERCLMHGNVVDLLRIGTTRGEIREFWFGYYHPYQAYEIEMASGSADVAAQQLNDLLEQEDQQPYMSLSQFGFAFDPDGPEQAGAQAKHAFDTSRWDAAFTSYVRAIDRLHDLYLVDGSRSRRPGPRDALLVDGLVTSLGVLRSRMPHVDPTEGVCEATHRLRTITTACNDAGINSAVYHRGLDGLAREAPDVDVSKIFWR